MIQNNIKKTLDATKPHLKKINPYFIIVLQFIIILIIIKSKTNFSFDIAALLVGFATLRIIWQQFKDQKELSKRLADLQFCKIVEERLLAIVYQDIKIYETSNSVPTIDYYKFYFLRGLISITRDAYNTNIPNIFEYEFTKNTKQEYVTTYSNLLESIKTPDIKKYYQNSQFQKVYNYFEENNSQ